jgi:hypothetical protein
VTSFGDGSAEDTRTLFFTPEDVWIGDVPGLTDALTAAGTPGATYLRRPVTTGTDGGAPLLVDAVTELLLNLSARTADDPRAFLDGGYTWQGQRSIDSRLATLFGMPGGRTVAVAASDDLLTQFATTLGDAGLDVTITLSEHGTRRIDLPAEEETADATQHPEVGAALGVGKKEGPVLPTPRELGAGPGTGPKHQERAASSPDRPLPGPSYQIRSDPGTLS